MWKGGTCNNRLNGCKYAHPTPCNSSACASRPANGCRAFHPRRDGSKGKGNEMGGARRGSGGVPNQIKKRPDGSHRPNARKVTKGSSGNSSSSGGSGSLAHSRLQERVATVERTVKGMGKGNTPSYRDVAIRGLLPRPNHSGSNLGRANYNAPLLGPVPTSGGFAHVQPDPAMLSAVVAAVIAVMQGGSV